MGIKNRKNTTVVIDILGERSVTILANVDNPLRKVLAASIFTDFGGLPGLDPGDSGGGVPDVVVVNPPPTYDPADTSDPEFYEDATYYEPEPVIEPEVDPVTGEPEWAYTDPLNPAPANPPSVIMVSSVGERDANLEWNAVPDAKSYKIFYALDEFSTYQLKTYVFEPYASITALYPDTTYWFKVKASNTYGDSLYSKPVKVTTNRPYEAPVEYVEEPVQDTTLPPKEYVKHYFQIDEGEPIFLGETTQNDPIMNYSITLSIPKGIRRLRYYNNDNYPWKTYIRMNGKRIAVFKKSNGEVKVIVGKFIQIPIVQPISKVANKTKVRTTALSGTGLVNQKKKRSRKG